MGNKVNICVSMSGISPNATMISLVIIIIANIIISRSIIIIIICIIVFYYYSTDIHGFPGCTCAVPKNARLLVLFMVFFFFHVCLNVMQITDMHARVSVSLGVVRMCCRTLERA